MSRLVYTPENGGAAQSLDVTQEGVLIGRDPACHLILGNDPLVSRKHARVFRKGYDYYLEDLGSRNGSFVNGNRVNHANLRDGDSVRVGRQQMKFEERPDVQLMFDPASSSDASESVFARPVDDLVTRMSALCTSTLEKPAQQYTAEDVQVLSRKLAVFYALAGRLNEGQSLRAAIDEILNLVGEVIPYDRAFLLLNTTEGALRPYVIRDKYAQQRVSLSSTVVNRCLNEKAAVLVKSPLDDPNLMSAQSIIAQNIRSAMCVPLKLGDSIKGVMYVDRTLAGAGFSEGDLELFAAIGHQAAIVVERHRLIERLQHEQAMRASLGKFLDEKVVDYLLSVPNDKQDELLAPRETEATVLFCDIKGFTRMSEGLTPIEVAEFINEYLSVMTEIIFKHQGTLDKYIGDCIMALFGAPLRGHTDAKNAVKAGLEMMASLDRLMSKHTLKVDIAHRIGINTGTLVAGRIGSVRRMEYGVLGDTVNVASRLESNAEPNSILISKATYELVKEDFECTYKGPLQAKNRKEPIETWVVLRPKA